MHVIKKAKEHNRLKYSLFGLLVKPLNKKSFLITKENDGRASFRRMENHQNG